MSNVMKMGTAVISLLGLGALTMHFNQRAYRAGRQLIGEVCDSYRDIKENGPDFSGVNTVFNLPDLEKARESN